MQLIVKMILSMTEHTWQQKKRKENVDESNLQA